MIGNVGADPEIRRTQDGRPIANLRIATSETWRDRNSGERREKTEWHTVVVFNEGLCKVVEQYVKKGAKLYIEGQLQTRKWQDQTGNDRYSTEVVLQGFNSTLTMLDGRGGEGGGAGRGGSDYGGGGYEEYDQSRPSSGGARSGGQSNQPNQGGNFSRDLDDDIPFDRLRQPVRDHPARFVAGRSRCAFRPETPNARRPRRIERRVRQG